MQQKLEILIVVFILIVNSIKYANMDGRLTIGYRDYTYPFLRPSFCQAPTSRHVVTLLKNDRIFGRSIPTVRCSVQSQ